MAKMVNLASLLAGTSPASRHAATPPRGAAAETAEGIIKTAHWDRACRQNIVETAMAQGIEPDALGQRSKRYGSAKVLVECARVGSLSGTAAMIAADIKRVLFPSLSVIGPEGLKKSVKVRLADMLGVDGATFIEEQMALIVDFKVDDKDTVLLSEDGDESVLVGQHSALLGVIEGPLEAIRDIKDTFATFKASFGTPVEAQVLLALKQRLTQDIHQEAATEVAAD